MGPDPRAAPAILPPYTLAYLKMGPVGFEPATSCSGGKRSIQLSYGPLRAKMSPDTGRSAIPIRFR